MQLEKCRWLSLSPLFPYSSLSGEDKERTVHSHHGMPSMAKSTMVSPYIRVSVRHTKNLTTRPPITDLSIRKSASARGGQPYASRLETIRIGLESKGFSGNTVKVLLAGSRTSTLSTYESAWRNWNNWCAGEHHDPMSNDLTVMLDFLTTLHMEGSTEEVLEDVEVASSTTGSEFFRTIAHKPMQARNYHYFQVSVALSSRDPLVLFWFPLFSLVCLHKRACTVCAISLYTTCFRLKKI
ncbi:uncharacterized protein LOC116936180 isoform X2 [Daphnia magna]|uniref:uncharacterized protein LOC116936180 isoform X2 n=1 Tax=Daphnia magna TaxID=35525 RepID=UPI001E1BD668|nr:uncharacterized protein LOC116936180 isoform X2 [Daphnia magna]